MTFLHKSDVRVLTSKVIRQVSSYVHPSFRTAILESTYINKDAVAIVDKNSSYKYKYLIRQSGLLQKKIAELKISNKNIAVLLPNDVSFVIGLFGIWKSKNAVVPLHIEHPKLQLEYFIQDSESALIVTTSEINERLHGTFKKTDTQVLVIDDEVQPVSEEDLTNVTKGRTQISKQFANSRALVIYTSGTTGKPKGVVLSHINIGAQVKSIAEAWNITKEDTCLHCLPLHHVHGTINALLCPLARGGTVMMEPKFDAYEILQKLSIIPSLEEFHPTIFMGVPTMYTKLIDMYHQKYDDKPFCREFINIALSKYIRLMVSGSAPLRPHVMREWLEISGHTLLERYGMTEVGMALTNPLVGERKPGFVGNPFPGVRVRIAQFPPGKGTYNTICEGDSTCTKDLSNPFDNQLGELLVKSDNVFQEYWKRPLETESVFTLDGWFITGDTAIYQNGSYKILGRTKADIFKSGGFKVSALEVENVLLDYPDLKEVAVVSIYDRTWGEKICAIIVLQEEHNFNSSTFVEWAKERLPHYQVPKVIKIFNGDLPRNSMGKMNRNELTRSLFSPVDIV